MNFGYWVDVANFQFDEDSDRTSWIQAFPLGSYKHPLYGSIDVTHERVQQFANNVQDGVRGTALDIDYDHKEYSGKAAGWVKEAEARDDGLWVQVEWTEDAYSSIKKGEYRYFSPEFSDKWTHPKTGQVHQNVLFGGALTNRPFLKDILPINMSELSGGEKVDEFLNKLRVSLGLSEGATEDEILDSLAQALQSQSTPEPEPEADEETETEEPAAEEQLALLAEQHPTIARLMETVARQGEAIQVLTEQRRNAEIERKLSEWTNRKSGRALAPSAHDDVRKALSEGTTDSFEKALNTILDRGIVDLSERGRAASEAGGGDANVVKSFDERVKALMASDGISYGDAAVRVAADNPELHTAYLSEVTGV